MMKKFLFVIFMLCMQIFTLCVMAGQGIGTIRLKKSPIIIGRIPGTHPLSEEVVPFSAFQNLDEIIVTSELVSAAVTVTIYSETGMVMITTTETIAIGEDITLDITSLPAGAYILSVSFSDTTYVGQFEV